MKKCSCSLFSVSFFIVVICSCTNDFNIANHIEKLESIEGKLENADFLYTTASPKIYSIGNQAGQFPEIGFHVPGEMGGIWLHPIKLLDGFSASIVDRKTNKIFELSKAKSFRSYALASQFEYELKEENLDITRTDFAIDQMPVLIVEYKIRNRNNGNKIVSFDINIDSDLSPVWLGERSGMKDGNDNILGFNQMNQILVIKDSLSNWYAGVGVEDEIFTLSKQQKSKYRGNGIRVKLSKDIDIDSKSDKIIRFYFSGSIKNKEETERNIAQVRDKTKEFVNDKIERYNNIENVASISIPDKEIEKIYKWGKYNTDWLVRDIEGLGRGISAGLPDYPWFFSNDQSSAIKAILGTRDASLFKDSWEMLRRKSDEFNDNSGRIVHEMSSNGSVYDKGRMEESQEFIIAAWNIFKWTGDMDFLKIYYLHGKNVWTFLQQHDKNSNLYIEGYGGTEIEGLNDEMLDVAVHTQRFFDAMANMANVLGDKDVSDEFTSKAIKLKKQINDDWWIEKEKRFGDFIASKDKAIHLINTALNKRVNDNRNLWAKEKLLNLKKKIEEGRYNDKAYAVFYNAAGILPLAEGISDRDKAEKMLSEINFFTNKFGMYITGIERPDNIKSEENSVASRLKGDFNYNQAIMPFGTSRLILSAANYLTADETLEYMRLLVNNFGFATPGTTYEVSPDYGMFVQAWNVCGINIPLIHSFFGVSPMASERRIVISPNMPSKWEYAKLNNLLIGNTKISIAFKKINGVSSYEIKCSEPNWNIEFKLPEGAKEVKLDNHPILDNKIVLQKQTQKIDYIQ